jgi:hypothetical protein
LAEDEKAFVRIEGDLMVTVEALAMVDSSIGAFDRPPARLDDEAAAGFRPRHDADA